MTTRKKGVSPVIATILLVGVVTLAVGGVYTFTQGKIGNLGGESAPKMSMELKGAWRNLNTPVSGRQGTCCGGEPGFLMKHVAGDSIPTEKLAFKLIDKTQAYTCRVQFNTRGEWNPGEEMFAWGFNSCSFDGAWIVADNQGFTGSTMSGSFDEINEGETITVEIIHQPTDKIIAKDTVEEAGRSKRLP